VGGGRHKRKPKHNNRKRRGREGISHHTMHLLETSYAYKPVLGEEKKKELIHADHTEI